MLHASFEILWSNKNSNLHVIVDEEGNMELTYACLDPCFQILSTEVAVVVSEEMIPDGISLESLS